MNNKFSLRIIALLFLCMGHMLSQAQVSVTATSGTTGPTSYTTVNAAFTAINAGTHQGAITITVTANTTEPATPVPLLKSATPSSYTSVTIKPQGNVTIGSAAAPVTNRGILELTGADNVTVDGDDPGTTGTQNLTILSVTSTTAGIACVRLSSNSTTGTDGADNITIKNCIITGSRSSATSTVSNYGIQFANGTSTSSSTTGAYQSINTIIQNNIITRAYYGIHTIGNSGYSNTGLQILNNVIGDATSANNVGLRAIDVTYSSTTAGTTSAVISGNDIRCGDYGTTGFSASIAGIEVGTVNAGLTIKNNNIHDINQPSSGGYGAHGILISGSTSNSGINIFNNFIRDVKMYVYQTSATSTFIPVAVFFTAGATGVNFNYNTISMGTQIGTGTNYSSFCVDASVSGVTFAQFQNNILVNTHSSTFAYGFYTAATANISAATVNRNDYYAPSGNIGYYNAANQATLSAWQTATGKDANSVSVLPSFVSATNLHLNTTGNGILESGGAAVTGITTDIDGDTRPGPTGSINGGGTTPDIGADEFDGVPAVACVAPTAQPTSLLLTPTNTTIAGSFTAASPVASNYLVVLATGSAVPSNPVNGTNYSAGSTALGTGTTVIGNVAATSFSAASLASNTAYTVYIFANNTGTCIGGPQYRTTSPLTLATATCPAAPTSVTTSGLSATGFTLNWTAAAAGGGANTLTYTVDVSTNSTFTAPVTGSPFTTSGVTQTVTGLTGATVYYYRVGTVGGSCITYSTTGNVTTTCPVYILPVTQGFNSSTIPVCWTTALVGTTQTASKISFPTSGSFPTTNPKEGTNMVMYSSFSNAGGGAGSEERLVSAALNTTASAGVNVIFFWRNENNSSYSSGAYLNEGVQLQYSINNGTTWTNVGGLVARHDGTLASGTAQWNLKTLSLPSAALGASSVLVGFKFHSEYGDNMYMDSVSIYEPPPCTTPNPGNTLTSNSQVCIGTSAVLSVQNATPGVVVTYQWDSSLNGTTYYAITGATSATYLAYPAGATYYRANVTCSVGPATSTSTPVLVNVLNCNFDVTRNAGIAYSSIAATGTSATFSGTSTDDNTSLSQPIGFPFFYKGNTYTKFKMCTNGWMTLDTLVTSTAYTNYFTTTSKATLAPFWEDLICQGNPGTTAALAASMKYQTTGTAPNRKLTVEWIGMETFGNPGPNLNFQVILYENGNIDYVYGTMVGFNGTTTKNFTYTTGLSSSAGTGTTLSDVMVQKAENTNYFAPISGSGLDTAHIVPECNSALSFTPGNYTGPNSFTPLPPVNDDPSGAITLNVSAIPDTNYCGQYYTSRAATPSPQASTCTTAPDDDVWFQFIAPISGRAKISVGGSGNYDPVAGLYDNFFNQVVNGASQFGCVNATGVGLTETISAVGLAAGGTYYVRVSHYGAGFGQPLSGNDINGNNTNTSGGMFYISVNDIPPPPNDSICGAIPLLVDTACTAITGTTSSATPSVAKITSTCNTPDDDVWYVFVPTATDNIVTVQSGSGFNAAIQIDSAYNNTCTDSLVQKACINSTSTGGIETYSGPWHVGTPYYLRVYHAGVGYGTGSGSFTICVKSTPPSCPTLTAPVASASVPTTGVTITWNPVNNASGYDVYVSTTQSSVVNQLTAARVATNQAPTSFNTGALIAATVYYYKIVAVNAFGQRSASCAAGDFNTNAPVCLSAPTSPVNSGTPCSTNNPTVLSWPASPGATGYDVYFDMGTGPASTLVSSNQAGNTYTTASPLAAGSYVWRIVPRNTNGSPTGCSDWTFTVLQSPTVTVSPTSADFCGAVTSPVQLTASGNALGYTWSPTSGLYTNAAGTTAYTGGNTPTVYASPASTTTYTVTGSSSAGCNTTATATININPIVDVSPSAKLPSLCPGGGTDTLYANASIYDGGAYCATSNAGGSLITNVSINTLSNSSTTNQPSASPYYSRFSATGTQTTTLNAGTSYSVGVDVNASAIVSVWIDFNRDGTLDASEWAQPYISATTGNATIAVPANAVNGWTRMRVRSRASGNQNGAGDACLVMGSGETEDYDIKITGGVAPSTPVSGLTYSWTPATNLNSASVANPEATISTTTTFTVTATSAAGCSATDTVRVNVGTPLATSASASYLTRCAGQADTLKSVTTGGGTPYSYSWSDGTAIVSTSSKFTASPTTTTTYTLTVTDACSSTATSSVTVTVNPLPTVTLSPSATTTNICANGSQLLTVSTNATSPSYQFQMNGVNITGATSSTYSATVDGLYRAFVVNTTTGCADTSSRDTLVVNQLPVVHISPVTGSQTCGGLIQLDALTVGTSTGTVFNEDFNSGLGTFTQTTFTGHAQGNWLPYPNGYVYSSVTFNTLDASNFVMINSDSNGLGNKQRLYLKSAPFASTGYDSLSVVLEHYYRNLDSAVMVQASTDGTTWTTVRNLTGTNRGYPNSSFVKDTFAINGKFGNKPNVYLRFVYASSYGWYWGINNVSVIGKVLVPTTATWTPSTDLYTNATGTTPYVANTTANTVYSKASTDIKYIATYSNGTCSDTVSASITVTGTPGSLAGTSGTVKADTGSIFNASVTIRDQSCNLIATVAPSGAQPVTGYFGAFVTNDNSVQSYLALPYATRHYDINPQTNAANATGNVTLYFTQAEMNAYNSYLSANNMSSTVTAMPTGSSDAQGIANLRIKQYHGTGTAPGNYTGSTVSIIPTAITWNSTNSWWEVTFPVTGFSGFYLTTGRFPTIAVKVFLQGPLSSATTMDNYLQDYFGGGSGLLPTTNPYGVSGDSYSQINDATGPAGSVVDWIKVELRDAANPSVLLQTKALLLKPNGAIVDSLGNAPYFNTQLSSVMVALYHRNHLAILSNPITPLQTDDAKTYDFTTSLSQANNPYFDPQQMVQKFGVWCMWAGDVNSDLGIDGSDYGSVYFSNTLSPFDVYTNYDLNMDGGVDGTDLGRMYFNNTVAPYSTLLNY